MRQANHFILNGSITDGFTGFCYILMTLFCISQKLSMHPPPFSSRLFS